MAADSPSLNSIITDSSLTKGLNSVNTEESHKQVSIKLTLKMAIARCLEAYVITLFTVVSY